MVLYTPGSDENVTVIHPNEDGSYWRKIVRNKVRVTLSYWYFI